MISEDDPAFGIIWHDEVIIELVRALNAGDILNLPQPPHFINFNSVSAFKDGIIAFLGEVGGGTRANFICPNNLDQYGNILIRLGQMEVQEYIQRLRIHVNHSFGYCVKIIDRTTVNLVPTNKVAPQHPFLTVFD
eukprot:gene22115-28634_t